MNMQRELTDLNVDVDWDLSATVQDSQARHYSCNDDQALPTAKARLAESAEWPHEEYYQPGRSPSGANEEVIGDAQSSASFDAVVTRNHYGSLILNAFHVLFIDVDVLKASVKPQSANTVRSQPIEKWRSIFDDIRMVLANEKNDGFRIYRTAAGFRILTTSREFEPSSQDAARLMSDVGADPAFMSLCRTQKNFRARLSPKPWRCGSRRPPNLFPRRSARESQYFAEWLSQYEDACRSKATCHYLGHVGQEVVDSKIAPIVEFHDRETKALQPLQLA